MSAKNRDNKNRWRNITVGFRVILLPSLSQSGCGGAGQSEGV